MDGRLNVVALVKDGERYIYLYDRDPVSYAVLQQTLARHACNPGLTFNWRDAAVLSRQAVEIARQWAEEETFYNPNLGEPFGIG